jgi:Heparan-alpha-glucosaminide N-acetyltransferase, catalytic/Protein of unknown function (DUF418)
VQLPDTLDRSAGHRIAGLDLARALAMLGMLVEHTLQYPTIQAKGVLWSVYGRSAPLFVLLAGAGLSLATRTPRQPGSRAMVGARAPLLLLVGMVLSTWVNGVILQSFALFFLVGLCVLGLPRRVLAALAGACLVGGPLVLTLLRRSGEVGAFASRDDIGLPALLDPARLLRALVFEQFPAVVWLGFFLLGMVLGRSDITAAGAGRRLFVGASLAAAVLFIAGWAGARAFGPDAGPFGLAPPPPTSWSGHWTTYGFSDAVGWTLSSAALALAVAGGCLWVSAGARVASRALAPVVALGATSLTFYVIQFVYLDTAWLGVQPLLTTTATYFLGSLAFWLLFALLAQAWLHVFRRGPLESVLHLGALAITGTWAAGQGGVSGGRLLRAAPRTRRRSAARPP